MKKVRVNSSPPLSGLPSGTEDSGADAVRLNKALADAGLCSRRRADELIFSGVVRVNGHPASGPGMRVLPGRDRVDVAGRPVLLREAGKHVEQVCWLMLHKPVQVVATVRDPEGRRTVLDLVPEPWRSRRLYPVGRLDYFSEGLLLLTDDGELAHRLTHPRWHLPRVYEVRVRPEHGSCVPESALNAMREGMTLREGEKLAPVTVERVSEDRNEGNISGKRPREPGILLRMTLHQGLNRQIRRMCRDLGLTVLRLKRVSQGPVSLGTLPSGRVRPLKEEEVAALRRAVGL